MARRQTNPSRSWQRSRERALTAESDRNSRKIVEIDLARRALAARIEQDVGWWYEQAQRIVTEKNGREDDNATRVVLAVFSKILPDKKEVVKEEGGDTKPPVAVIVNVPGRGTIEAREAGSKAQRAMIVEALADDVA